MAAVSLKCVLVGDAGIGKTSLLYKHVLGHVPEGHGCLSSCDNHVIMTHVDGEKVQLRLWDTEGSKDYDRLRPLSYPNTNLFLLCFSVDEPTSLKSIKERWYPELNHHCPGTPIILVGTKEDLRGNRDGEALKEQPQVSAEEGLKMSREIGAGGYVECSASSGGGVAEVFTETARLATASPVTVTRSRCRRWKCAIS